MIPSKSSRFSTSRLLSTGGAVIATALLTGAAGASATATSSDIANVWSFGGGKVAVQQLSDGTYAGTVVAATQFATCSHPVGEQMWTNMHQLADGSYQGFHQWFIGGSKCNVSPTRGLTAWRVLQNPDGSHFLRVCFSTPGSSEQPTIAANGTSANVDYGCSDSALIAPLPSGPSGGGQTPGSGSGGQGGSPSSSTTPGARGDVESFGRSVLLPSARKCLSRRSFKINLRSPTNDPLKLVVVTIKGHRVGIARTQRAITAGISLKNLPRGTYTVKISATTVLGHRLTGTRTYHTCAAKRKSTKPAKLHRA